MKRGAIYLLKGGHVLRCHGPYAGKGPAVAFRPPSVPLGDDAAGYSAAEDVVLHEVTTVDLGWLHDRLGELEARDLMEDAAEIRVVIRELKYGA